MAVFICVRFFLYLGTEERLRKTETIHYVDEVIQCVVENSVELLASESHCLDRRQGSSVQLSLKDRNTSLLYTLIMVNAQASSAL